ncbi:MAG: insulinase family protein [Myxococcaceae bacterium]
MKRSLWFAFALTSLACATTPAAKPEPSDTPEAVEAAPPAKPVDPRKAAPTEAIPNRPFNTPPPLHTVVMRSNVQPVVSFRFVFRSGSIDDPAGKEGLTNLTATVMSEGGTRELSSSQIIEALFPMSAELSMSTSKEFTVLEGRVHKDFLDAYLKILTDVLLEPRFDGKEFTRLRSDALDRVKNGVRSENDELLGKLALDSILYEGHPAAHFTGGTVQGLKSITLEDLKAQAKTVFTQDRLVVGLAGPVDAAIEKKVKERLSALPKTGAARATLPPVPGIHGHAVLVQKNVLSTAISMGFAYPVRRGDPDFFALALAASYLGEHRQFNGVLFNELREKRGLNYGDYAYAETFQQEGGSTLGRTNVGRSTSDFTIWIRPVEPANGLFAAKGAVYFLHKLLSQGMPEDRFEVARSFLIGYTRLWEQTDQRRLGYAIDDVFYGTKNYLESYRAALKDMTSKSVLDAVRRHVAPDKLNYAFVAKDSKELALGLINQPPSPISYPSPKDPSVLLEDEKIIEQALAIEPTQIRFIDAATFMEK